MASDKKQQLVDFVVRRAFDPVMRANAKGRSESEKRKLQHVQDATQAEIERFHGSAREVVTNFRRDLSSAPAKRIHADLRSLHLPTIEDIRDEFESKAAELGV